MNNLRKSFRNIIVKNKFLLFKSILLVFLLIVFQVFLPLLMRKFISQVSIIQSVSFLLLCVFIYALFILIYNIIDVTWMKFLDKLGGIILEGIRRDLYYSITNANYEKLILIGKEKLKNILYMDTLNIFSSIACHSIQICVNLLLIIVFLVISAYIDLKLTLILLIASIIGFLISMFSRKPISNASMKVNIKMKEDNKTLNEYIDALELAKTNNLDEYFLNKSKQSLWNFINTSIKADNTLVFLKNLVTGFHQVVSISIASFLSMTMQADSVGDLVFYLFVSNMVLDISQQIESSIYSLVKMIPSFKNVNEILNLAKCGGNETINSIETIEFKDVTFRYQGNERAILYNKNELFKKGDIIRITGQNGGGKSTFVKLLQGLLYPKVGDVLLNGISTKTLDTNSIKNQILYIDQDEIILNDNIKNYLEAISEQSISKYQLKELKNIVRFDENIFSISENGRSLSGGQRKKLLMIKLLLKYNLVSVIILDELEAGLDAETKNIVTQLEKEIIKNNNDFIFFKITHETQEDDIFNRIITF
ncbi:ATP-binding cassette domain-containing protein [Clostridium ihumii]|uniref:ATP-binding cassette domain-containing protein n=1 Tax=Clostridium ihumii TaxID=1470356 RepID=UPI00058C6022|nr:ABC transporter ATP-binding protein [Clostridium ihumii]